MWNAFPGSLLFVACRAGIKRRRKARMIFVVFREKPASEPSARDVFRKRCPIRGSARVVFKISRPFGGSARDVFRKRCPFGGSAKDVFKISRPFGGSVRVVLEKNILPNVFFLGLFFKLSPSRVVFRWLFSKSPLRALFLGGFFPNHPFARCFWEVFFPSHPFARCFWEAFFQITLSRVVSRRFFFKNSIPMCLEMLFSLGGSSFWM